MPVSPEIRMVAHPGDNCEPETGQFGTCRRIRTRHKICPPTCGKINSIIKRCQDECRLAAENILLRIRGDEFLITIDNQLLEQSRAEGLFLKKERCIATHGDGTWQVMQVHSTAKTLRLISTAVERFGEQLSAACIGDKFPADCFYYQA